MKLFATICLVVLASACSSANDVDGPILTSDAAVEKAKIAWESVYRMTHSATFSDETVRRFEPYTAVLSNGVWKVRGTIPADFRGTTPEATVHQADGFTSVEGVKH